MLDKMNVSAGIDGIHILWRMAQVSGIVLCNRNGTLERWMCHPSRRVGQSQTPINQHTQDRFQLLLSF